MQTTLICLSKLNSHFPLVIHQSYKGFWSLKGALHIWCKGGQQIFEFFFPARGGGGISKIKFFSLTSGGINLSSIEVLNSPGWHMKDNRHTFILWEVNVKRTRVKPGAALQTPSFLIHSFIHSSFSPHSFMALPRPNGWR